VNRPIRILSIGVMVMFMALLLNATYLQYVEADDLNNRADNRRVRDAEFSRERGAILVRGRPVAESVPSDDQYEFQRRYPQPLKYAHLSGFFAYIYGFSGVEASQNDVLSGSDPRLFVNRVVDTLSNTQPKGGSVTLTINPRAQDAAFAGLQALGTDAEAAVVALEPSTGKVLAMASNPAYDPNRLATHDLGASQDAYRELNNNEGRPLVNRAIQDILPPGSTFKLVTAAAALADGYDPQSMVPGQPSLDLPQTDRDLPNLDGASCGGDQVTLTQAMMVSCNVAFGHLGLELGEDALREQAQKFGFGDRWLKGLGPQAESVFPDDASGPFAAYSAIGQYEVATSVLQMAQVVSTIANGGQGMVPYVVDEVRAPDLSVLDKTSSEEMPERAMSASAAGQLTDMMVAVVDSGTGTTAQLGGIDVAGKTGTAQSQADRPPYAWFVSFAPADDPQVAVAVVVEDAGVARDAISGSGLAAPVARAIMEAVVFS
jgi:penicillin-binding protein A